METYCFVFFLQLWRISLTNAETESQNITKQMAIDMEASEINIIKAPSSLPFPPTTYGHNVLKAKKPSRQTKTKEYIRDRKNKGFEMNCWRKFKQIIRKHMSDSESRTICIG